jgi:hypothetical protein
MSVAWVFGSGGLLGFPLFNVLCMIGTAIFSPPEQLAWQGEATNLEQC